MVSGVLAICPDPSRWQLADVDEGARKVAAHDGLWHGMAPVHVVRDR